MNPLQVSVLVAEVLGTKPRAVIHQPFGHKSVTYEAVLPECSVIVRTNEDAEVFTATDRNSAVLAGLGLPVPKVRMSDLTKTRYPFAYMLLDKIPGCDLRDELAHMTSAQMTRLAELIVDYQSRVMTLPLGTGYGYTGIGEKGPYTSWWDLLWSQDGAGCAQAPGTGSLFGMAVAGIFAAICRSRNTAMASTDAPCDSAVADTLCQLSADDSVKRG